MGRAVPASKPRKGAGRPTMYSQTMADTICDRMANGESLKTIIETPGMPKRSTIGQWCRKDVEFAAMYARAKEDRADVLADEIVAIVDSVDQSDAVAIQGARLKMDARKWAAAKLNPKYDNKTLHGSDPENPLPAGFNVILAQPPKMTDGTP